MVYGSQYMTEQIAHEPADGDHSALEQSEEQNHGEHRMWYDTLGHRAGGYAYGETIHG